MQKKTDHIKIEEAGSVIQRRNISQAKATNTMLQPLKQQDVGRSSGSIITDRDLRVISISQSWWNLYGVEPFPLPAHLRDIVHGLEAVGWFTLSNAFSEHCAVNALMHKIEKNQYFHDFAVSPLGDVIDLTFYTDHESGNNFFNYTPTGITVAQTTEKSLENRGLVALRDLINLGMFGMLPMTFELAQPASPTYAPVICAPKSGKLIILDETKSFPDLDNIQNVEDLSVKIQDINYFLDKDGQYSSRVELEGGKSLHLALKRHFFYAGGPSFIAGRVMKLCSGVSEQSILNKYPQFSSKEVEVVCLLALGYTIKEAAAKIGKAQVTVSLQARSALLKSRERSLNALVVKIVHSSLW
ncbi:hypothetical protein OAN307_c35420 [Octadecabacter antarcticus 307]|uniref:HTH luxR-type domain-containing protein n=1 Tax=Octadecabacter antarcticus 307 TaxID=391626 RepID=M9RGT0_9RHOB|nr:hypothetical protein [Octadecabacter antarcticus]AGI69020.1 hypothetical protein OAN307_c35420 [Octadecabacter antarcticus 307]